MTERVAGWVPGALALPHIVANRGEEFADGPLRGRHAIGGCPETFGEEEGKDPGVDIAKKETKATNPARQNRCIGGTLPRVRGSGRSTPRATTPLY